MMQSTVDISISLESLILSISKLSVKEKLTILVALSEQIEQAEEDSYEADPIIRAEIQEARLAYQAKDYVTIDEFNDRKKSS